MSLKKKRRGPSAKQLELERLKQNFKRLQSMTLGLSNPSSTATPRRKPLIEPPLRMKLDTSRSIPSHSAPNADSKAKTTQPKLSREMQEREAKAQAEAKRRSTYVAVPYNKGPYMYVGPDSDPTTFGRK